MLVIGLQSADMGPWTINKTWELVRKVFSDPTQDPLNRDLGVACGHLDFNEPLREPCSLKFESHHSRDIPRMATTLG